MTTKKGMAATYVEMTLQEMEQYLNRAFRVLHPKQGADRGEIYFDLHLSPTAGIRVWSSVPQHGTTGRGVGVDPIRVQFFNFRKNKPMIPGKAPIVKRTQGWRDNLRERIEEYMELYDAHEEDIEAGKFIDWNRPV
jgi:hypothetical protein